MSIRRKASPRAILIVVAFGIFIAADDLTVVTTMLRPIINDLGIVLPDGIDDAAWIVNVYLIAYVAVMPFMGRLSDVLGRRRVYIGALSLFLVGSVIIPNTTTLGPFLFGRVLTAMGGGALVPIGMAAVSDAYEARKRARALGVLAAIDTLGWVWGPLYGAMIIRFLTWQWQFYFNIPLAVIGIIAGWYVLDDAPEEHRKARVDWVGAALLTIALVALNLALLGPAEIQSVTGLEQLTGGSRDALMWLYPVALVAGIGFVWWQRRVDDPLIDPALFRGRNLVSAVGVNFFVGGTLAIAMVNVPLFINVVEFDIERAAVITGWVLSAMTASMSLASYVGVASPRVAGTGHRCCSALGFGALAFFLMGYGWDTSTGYPAMAWQLGLARGRIRAGDGANDGGRCRLGPSGSAGNSRQPCHGASTYRSVGGTFGFDGVGALPLQPASNPDRATCAQRPQLWEAGGCCVRRPHRGCHGGDLCRSRLCAGGGLVCRHHDAPLSSPRFTRPGRFHTGSRGSSHEYQSQPDPDRYRWWGSPGGGRHRHPVPGWVGSGRYRAIWTRCASSEINWSQTWPGWRAGRPSTRRRSRRSRSSWAVSGPPSTRRLAKLWPASTSSPTRQSRST